MLVDDEQMRENAEGRRNARDLRLLVIEDDDAAFITLQQLMIPPVDRGVKLTRISSFDEAVLAMTSDSHDVALVGGTGDRQSAETLLRVVGGSMEMPVIVMSGFGDAVDHRAVLEAGAADLVTLEDLSRASLLRSIDFAIDRFSTERKLRDENEALRRAFENAEAAHFSKSEFLEFLSCELRTPLNAVLGFSQVMKIQNENEASIASYRHYSEIIHDSGTQLLALVDDLLDMSETGRDAFDTRQQRFRRFRTWIVDRHDAREAHGPADQPGIPRQARAASAANGRVSPAGSSDDRARRVLPSG